MIVDQLIILPEKRDQYYSFHGKSNQMVLSDNGPIENLKHNK